jgi:hypothetical protein
MIQVNVDTTARPDIIQNVAAAQSMMHRAQQNQILKERHEMDKRKFGADLITMDIQQRAAEVNLQAAQTTLAEREEGMVARRLELQNKEIALRQSGRIRQLETTQAEQARVDFSDIMETVKNTELSPVEREGVLDRWMTTHQNLTTSELNPAIQEEFAGMVGKVAAAKQTLRQEYGQKVMSAVAPLSKDLAFAESKGDLARIAESPDFQYAKRDPEFAKAWDNAVAHHQKLELEQLKQAGEMVVGLRKEFNALPTVKNLRTVDTSFRKIIAGERTGDESAAGDLSLVFNYMKLLDPGSVVRESEFATAANAAGVPERIRARWNKLLSGQFLGPAQRADFRNQARNVFEAQVLSALPDLQQYSDLAGPGAGHVLNHFDQQLVKAGPDGVRDLIEDMSYGGNKDEITDADLQ